MTLIYAVSRLLDFYSLIIFIYVILSWFPVGRGGVVTDIYRVLASVCEPYIGIFRRIVPSVGGGIDFSPLVALLVLRYLIQPALIALAGMVAA
ncbi:MAG: YggT family protein [Anaerosomatales bacterium]|nr:YggT family protein [Anaerosomatales bacterium]MDT8433264.1 YggT family protein [Anaerosomatales bacterium]